MPLIGFGNHHTSEALPNTLPIQQNSPQQCPRGLYAEQLSGSAFTKPRAHNLYSWLYRILPSVVHQDFKPYTHEMSITFSPMQPPNPLRWSPLPSLVKEQDWIDGLFPIAGSDGLQTYIYQCNQSMANRYFCSRDGELLFVPYQGRIQLWTEFGLLEIGPGKIAVIPRGVYFKLEVLEHTAQGYLCENGGSPLTLPELGLIGSNGLAHPRHFIYPDAAFETSPNKVHLICKYQQQLWIAQSNHSPLNVVAWHGNYAPYSYDLSLFNTVNTVSFDHLDPSIFTVLTSASDNPGMAHFDFVIFPPRWMVAEHTFRPPYYHRNVMNELMGLIQGEYDAKKNGFLVGGVSIHNCMTAHGPDEPAFEQATHAELKPERYVNTLAFMFESKNPWLVTQQSLDHASRERNYSTCWQALKPHFNRS